MRPVSETINLVKLNLNNGSYDDAAQLCGRILSENPNYAEALHLLGIALYQGGRHAPGLEMINKAISCDPNNSEYYYNAGIIQSALGKSDLALEAYQKAIALKPDHAQALNNLGLLFYDQDKLEEAITLFKSAVYFQPDFSNAYYNLGKALQASGEPWTAIEAYDAALSLAPDSAEARFNRSLSQLLIGDYKNGWKQYEWRFKHAGAESKICGIKNAIRWDGSEFKGKRILVLDEQGFGDTLQFIRYLPLVKAKGGQVIFETVTPLMDLLQDFGAIDILINRSAQERGLPGYDFYTPLLSLPNIFETRLETIPQQVPYLSAENFKVTHWAKRLKSSYFKIGMVWSGKTSQDYRRIHSSGLEHVNLHWTGRLASKFASDRLINLECFEPLAAVPGIKLYGLQKGNAAAEVEKMAGTLDIVNFGQEFKTFADTAACMANLDLIITVDTAVAHLAGAMGLPVWVLIPKVPDWRWLLEREDSPWYPTMRLWRQQEKGDWNSVMQRIADDLPMLIRKQAIKG